MAAEEYYKIKIIPDEDRLTLDKLSSFEIGQIISHRISQIGKDKIIYLPDEYRYINANQINPTARVSAEDVIKNGNGSFVRLTSTCDIVYGEINTNNIPYLIMRTVSTDHQKKIVWVEIINPNEAAKEVLEYCANSSF